MFWVGDHFRGAQGAEKLGSMFYRFLYISGKSNCVSIYIYQNSCLILSAYRMAVSHLFLGFSETLGKTNMINMIIN